MLQLLALLAMEPPTAFEANRVRDEKLKVLDAIVPRRWSPTSPPWRFGRSMGRASSAGRRLPGYRRSRAWRRTRAPRRTRRCACACQLALGGRAVLPAHRQAHARKLTEISVRSSRSRISPSRTPARSACRRTGSSSPFSRTRASRSRLEAKIPGTQMRLRSVNMEYRYGTCSCQVARGLRAAYPRCDARGRHAVHPR